MSVLSRRCVGWLMMVCFVSMVAGLTGCSPMRALTGSIVEGGYLGGGPDNTLHRLKLIAKNVAIVYDPTITDGEFAVWEAEQRNEYRRFAALLELYQTFAVEPDGEVLSVYQDDVDRAEASLDAIVGVRASVKRE